MTDEIDDMAQQCVEMMRTMGAMMGMRGDSEPHAQGLPDMGAMGSMMDITGGFGLLVVILGLLVGAAVLLGIVLMRRRVGGRLPGTSPALAELDHRYARGELDRETFLRVRRDLQDARG